MLRVLTLISLGLLAGCTDGSEDYPRLLPTQQILAEPTLPDHAEPAATSDAPVRNAVEGQGAATRNAPDAIPDPVDEAALNARAADLRRRAEALRNQTTEGDAACPDGTTAPVCPQPAP
jgi:hypothetical protein